MRTYADSSFIIRLLSREPGTEQAVAEYRRLGRPRLFYLPLHALEVENALRQRAFHLRRITPSSERGRIRRERAGALSRLGQHRQRGVLAEAAMDMEAAIDRARELSVAHTDRLGARAIDLLHVACALLLETEVFLTFDQRQFELAKAEGLTVSPLVSDSSGRD
jgi:predicted nucleic acid-binding protein